jgi:signal transduction histidine kinase
MPSPSGIFSRLSRRAITHAGYVVMIGLLVFTATEAYRIQASFSEQSAEIYRHYVEQEETLFRLRQNTWRGSVYARDFFLSPDPNRASILKSQLRALYDESLTGLENLDRFNISDARRAEVRAEVREYWDALMQIPGSMQKATSAEAYEFTQREIVPRRSAANAVLRELTGASQQNMASSQAEFSSSRQAAAHRVFVMLGISVVLGLLVAGFSIWHTENLERERDRHLEDVEEARRELSQLSARLIEVQEEERGRLSRELHDEIGQILTALRIEISRSQAVVDASAAEARERLARARELAERAVHTVRNISLLLRPSALDDLGLIPALHWQVQDFSQRSGIECRFKEEGVQDHLPDAVKTCV